MNVVIRSTEWEQSQSNLTWFKRWFVLNAFPNTKKPHIATARVVDAEEVYGGIWDERMEKHDKEAKDELYQAVNYGGGGLNVVRFSKDDCLPVCKYP